jgi:hypothetical protein
MTRERINDGEGERERKVRSIYHGEGRNVFIYLLFYMIEKEIK